MRPTTARPHRRGAGAPGFNGVTTGAADHHFTSLALAARDTDRRPPARGEPEAPVGRTGNPVFVADQVCPEGSLA